MATLERSPASDPRSHLRDWAASNPLVAATFWADDTGVVRPEMEMGALPPQIASWLSLSARHEIDDLAPVPAPRESGFGAPEFAADAEQQVSLRKAESDADAALLAEPTSASAAASVMHASVNDDDRRARRGVSENIIRYQSARQEILQVAQKSTPAPAAEPEVAALAEVSRFTSESAAPAVASLAPAADTEALASAFAAEPAAAAEARSGIAAGGCVVTPPEPVADSLKHTNPVRLREPASGWSSWHYLGADHLFGWHRRVNGTLVGFEVNLAEIERRLGALLPAELDAGEAYALRDHRGTERHRVGGGDFPPVVEVPLATALLPGWSVAGYYAGLAQASSGDTGFLLGGLLVALLVATILAAGLVLVREARRSEAEAALKTSFVANVSHELKTPLTTIRLYSELLAQGRVKEEAKRADYLATIGRETERLGRLVGNVLDFSRLEQGKKKYARVDCDLAAMLRRLAEAHGPRLAEAGLHLGIETPERLGVATDPDAVEQIVLNLLDNVCKYASEGGEVWLTLESAASGARLTVADRGPGVPAEQRERIFEKFHRMDDRLTAEKPGAGLGLSIARQLARGLGGDLVCRAREGGGAEFVLTLS
ncbi:MAG: HAMP domain-containing histidine kinase, partial [Opitutaceae bacterium]|nr:HAMP domain-containing histidine kinase [Opitutaceae bacterium]